MLSIGKLAPGGAEYYLETVAKGAEEYYLGSGEAPGRWVGRGSKRAGFSGEVRDRQLRCALDGRDSDGRQLLARQGPQRMPGFDCTFNAPKSVSLLFALGSDDVRRQVSKAHDAAVDAALATLEDEACRVRRGRGGARIVDADGFVGAAFRHRTSRAGDPHLHTHVVVANMAHTGHDDRWTALDGRQLYAWCRTAGFLYEAHLRAELTGRLGVVWNRPRNGIADVAGIPRTCIDHFSQRRQQISEHMAQLGSLGGHAAQVATYATRQTKDTSTPYSNLRTWWGQRANGVGLDERSLASVLGVTARHRPRRDGIDVDGLFFRLDAPSGITEHRPTFDRRDVIRHVCDEVTAGASAADVLAIADEYLASSHVVLLAEPVVEQIRRADGRSAPMSTNQPRWTTPEMLRVERHLIQMATHRQGDSAGVARPALIEHALDERPTLTREQQVLVRRVCGSGDGVEVVPGIAGAGKTYALAAAHDAWKESGFTVIGSALSAQAARQLEAGSGIPSTTIARLQRDLGRPDNPGLTRRDVLVVDEAAMVGTRSLVDLIAHAHGARAKVVLIGDACQLPEIEAGGAFAGLARRQPSAGLSDNRRQHAPWERQALSDLRLGHVSDALRAYRDHDRVHVQPDPQRTREALVHHWWSTIEDGGNAVMLAAHHDAVRDLNARARERMVAAGRIRAEGVFLAGREFAVGDQVIGLRNDYRALVLNGTRGEVIGIDGRRGAIVMRTEDKTERAIPFSYAEAGNLAHGYATTVHKAQGATTDHALVLVDETMSREAVYTAMSRGRSRNDVFVEIGGERDDLGHAHEVKRDPVDVLAASIERSSAQRMAIDHGRSLGR